jgi:predicted CXXCH cytochrome family protein
VAYCLHCHSPGGSYEDDEEPPEVGDDYETGGHGHDTLFPGTEHGENGPGFSCSVCHDPDSPHVAVQSAPENRLRIDNAGSALCLDCHGIGGDETLGSAQTKVTSHTSSITGRHTDISQYDYQCTTCHDPHGTSNLAMIREEIDGGFGTATSVSFSGDDLTGLDPTTDPNNGVCDSCHEQAGEAHAETNHPNNHNHGMSCMICHRHNRSFWF